MSCVGLFGRGTDATQAQNHREAGEPWPFTLIVIDQAGVVRGFHAGYTADLREKVARRVDELLQKEPAHD